MSTTPTTPAAPTGPEAPGRAPDALAHPSGRVDIAERPARTAGPAAAFITLVLLLALMAGAVILFVSGAVAADAGRPVGVPLIIGGSVGFVLTTLLLVTSLVIVVPGQTSVRQFFGQYIGTVRRTGLVLVPPLTTGKKVSVKVHNFETSELKVNDLDGNPVNIAAIVVWQVADTARAVFAVEAYEEFIKAQAESALRHVATIHPYDEPGPGETSLRGGTDLVSAELAAEVAAREQIVEGAVTMVDQALKRLEADDIVTMDEERRAQMVSNLLVVLCSDQRTQPVVNTGSLYA